MADQKPQAHVVVELVDSRIPIESAVVIFAQEAGCAILESSLQNRSYGRFSIFAFDPVETFSVDRIGPRCPFRSLADHVRDRPAVAAGGIHLPFVGGWIGYVAYEAGLTIEGIERTTACGLPLPQMRLCLYDTAAVYDHNSQQWYMTAVAWPNGFAERRAPVGERLAALRARLEAASELDPSDFPAMPATAAPMPNMSHRAYLAKVERAKRYIQAGDIYQVNLTQRFVTRTNASPLSLYRRLRRFSPSPHAALLRWGDTAILSSSPELFLEMRDGHVVTRPIKGTRPRGTDAPTDAAYRSELTASEKDRAELTMIVDLLRNDLGRVCKFGSVRVTDPGTIETHPTVFHRVATVTGDLAPDVRWVDLLRAAFPGGSVTGAPKIRAMQIIDELEPTARDVYCGSIGMIGLDGSLSLNIAIRTMVQIGEAVYVYAGGAIVADSEPVEEYRETLAKAAGMFRALNCTEPQPSAPRQEVPIA